MDRDLTDDLLEEVLRRLPRGRRPSFAASTAGDVSLVSKRWLRLYRSTTSALSLRLPHGNSTPYALFSLLSHFPNISSLSLTVDDSHRLSFPPDQILIYVALSCRKLTHLSLQTLPPYPVSRSSLLSLSTSCPHLTSLHVAVSTPCSFHWLLSFHNLKHLSTILTSFRQVSEPVCAAASEGEFDGQLELETLSVSRTLPVGDYDLDSLWKSCKKLKKLHLDTCRFDTSASSFVNCLKGLQEVELLHYKPALDIILPKLVENGASLSSLLVEHYGNEPDNGTGLLHFITHSGCHLRKLGVRLPPNGRTAELLRAVAENCTGLSSLGIRCYSRKSGGELKAMMLDMTSELEELTLVECELQPGLVTILGQKFRNLRCLDLSWGLNVADEELTSMLASFNCLRELKLRGRYGWTKSNDAFVVSMSESCKQLEILDIIGCSGIKAESVELFIMNCPRLRRIHVEERKLSDVSKRWASKKLVEVFHR